MSLCYKISQRQVPHLGNVLHCLKKHINTIVSHGKIRVSHERKITRKKERKPEIKLESTYLLTLRLTNRYYYQPRQIVSIPVASNYPSYENSNVNTALNTHIHSSTVLHDYLQTKAYSRIPSKRARSTPISCVPSFALWHFSAYSKREIYNVYPSFLRFPWHWSLPSYQ